MMRRLNSIDTKFPLLMSGLVLATAVVFVIATYSQFAGSLYLVSGERLRTAALLIGNMVGDGSPRTQAQMTAISRSPAVIEFLKAGEGRDEALAVLNKSAPKDSEPSRLGVQLLDRNGRERLAVAWTSRKQMPRWASAEIASKRMSPSTMSFSPFLPNGKRAEYQIVSPVFAETRGVAKPEIAGYVVESRAVVGRGQKQIQELIGSGAIFLIGQPGGTWTDLESIVPGPPPAKGTNTPVKFETSARGAGIGVLQPVRGTPWLVWVQQPREVVLAPVNQFVLAIAPKAALIALLGALLVWVFSSRITRRIVTLTRDIDRMELGDGGATSSANDSSNEIDRLYAAFNRMSHRLKKHQELESQLRQSQKLEAVGRLAGGIAHDFNNMLTVVRNCGEMIREDLPPESELQGDVEQVLRAADRAHALTRQLLTFSRQQVVTPQLIDLNHAIADSERMLRTLIPSNIELVTSLDPDLGRIMADPGQIEQVMLNLMINAADAMPNGGRVTIHTRHAELDDTFEGQSGYFVNASANGNGNGNGSAQSATNNYAVVVFSDTGSGMDRETCARAFDPFFTTKPVGKGTGLGLATVHGIVMQNNGRIWVYSEPGKGTRFKIYFPVTEAASNPPYGEQGSSAVAAMAGGTETILLVEDDEATRAVTRRLLSKRGYVIIEARNGVEALKALESHAGRVDLVLADVMMPEMTGSELSERLAAERPDLPVVLMSGYADHDVAYMTRRSRSRTLVEKPFTAAAMLAAIRKALTAEAIA
jgi:signal transduction histidine kinase/ActR/RegA family two-component response regulator